MKTARNSRRVWLASLAVALFAAVSARSEAQAPASDSHFSSRPSGSILTAGSKRVMILAPDGRVVWEYPTGLTHDVWMLPSGNILFADGESVREVTRAKAVVWQYKAAEQKGGGTYACQRLANGSTMVGENSTGRILELDRDGKVTFSLQTSPAKLGEHHNLRMVRKLDNGNYLACHSGARLVKEYAPSGKVVWEQSIPGKLAFAAIRTSKGTTLVSSLDEVREYDSSGKVVWECSRTDVPGATIHNMTGMHLLSNGNLVVGCYQAYADGQGSGLLEFSRDKTLAWCFADPHGESTMMPVQLLTADGSSLPGPCLR